VKIINTKIGNVKIEVEQAIKFGSFQSSNLIVLVLKPDENSAVGSLLLDANFENVSKALAAKLVIMSLKDREHNLHELMAQLVNQAEDVCYLSRINLLFETSLQTDPLKLLQSTAKKKPIIVIWPGTMDDVSINYSKPGLPDYKSYKLNEFQDVQVITTCEQGAS
jgi:hypothetical protein